MAIYVCGCLAGLALGEDRYIEQPDLLKLLKKNQYLLSVDTFGGEGKTNFLPNYLSKDLEIKSVSAWKGGIIFLRNNSYYYPFSSSPLPDVRKLRDAQTLSEVVVLLAGKDDINNLKFFKKTNQLEDELDFSQRFFEILLKSAHVYNESIAVVDCLVRFNLTKFPPKRLSELLTFQIHDVTVGVRISGALSGK